MQKELNQSQFNRFMQTDQEASSENSALKQDSKYKRVDWKEAETILSNKKEN